PWRNRSGLPHTLARPQVQTKASTGIRLSATGLTAQASRRLSASAHARLRLRCSNPVATSAQSTEVGESQIRAGYARAHIGVSDRSGAPWLRFVWSRRECPDPAGRRRVKRSVYLRPKGARGHEHAEEAPGDQAPRVDRRSPVRPRRGKAGL